MSIQAIKAIDGIRFSVWSPTEIRKYSVAEITAPETYDEDGMPVQGGLMDGRLGTLEPGQKCLTCCLLYTSPSPRDQRGSRMPSSA